MTIKSKIKVGTTWTALNETCPVFYKNANRWKECGEVYLKVDGVWKTTLYDEAYPGVYLNHTINITAFADYSGTVTGTVRATSVNHGLITGTRIRISGTINFNGTYPITRIGVNLFYFTHASHPTETGVSETLYVDWQAPAGAYVVPINMEGGNGGSGGASNVGSGSLYIGGAGSLGQFVDNSVNVVPYRKYRFIVGQNGSGGGFSSTGGGGGAGGFGFVRDADGFGTSGGAGGAGFLILGGGGGGGGGASAMISETLTGTADATNNLINLTAHRFSASNPIYFTVVIGGGNIAVNTQYRVINVTYDTFQISSDGTNAININAAAAGTVSLRQILIVAGGGGGGGGGAASRGFGGPGTTTTGGANTQTGGSGVFTGISGTGGGGGGYIEGGSGGGIDGYIDTILFHALGGNSGKSSTGSSNSVLDPSLNYAAIEYQIRSE